MYLRFLSLLGNRDDIPSSSIATNFSGRYREGDTDLVLTIDGHLIEDMEQDFPAFFQSRGFSKTNLR